MTRFSISTTVIYCSKEGFGKAITISRITKMVNASCLDSFQESHCKLDCRKAVSCMLYKFDKRIGDSTSVLINSPQKNAV